MPTHPATLGWSQLSVQGPLGRTVGDVALVMSAIAGPDRRVPISLSDDPAGFALALAEALDAGDAPDHGGARIHAGRALAEEHSWDTAARAHLLFYERLLDEGVLRARRSHATSRKD